MPYIYNCTDADVTTQVFGNWFKFKSGQIKWMDEHMVRFIEENRQETGLVGLPDTFEDPGFKTTEEGEALLASAKEKGITRLVDFYREVIKNNQVSLRRDLARANEKVDPAVEASKGEIEAMRIVAKYQRLKEDTSQKRIDEVKTLLKDVGPL